MEVDGEDKRETEVETDSDGNACEVRDTDSVTEAVAETKLSVFDTEELAVIEELEPMFMVKAKWCNFSAA